jgi:L-cysteine desulfidase
MSGAMVPVMSNSGSGNQGISATVPVVIFSRERGVSREQLLRALALSHLTVVYIKQSLGRLSALCGCVIASTGSSCGIVMLKKGNLDQICYSIKNMIGNITGMVCDGAKVGCALKVASGVSSAVQSAILALDNKFVTSNDGIIEDDVEKTIRNLGSIGSTGMQVTDSMILNIMVCK